MFRRSTWFRSGLLGGLVACAVLLLGAYSGWQLAEAGVGFSVTPTFPSPVTVGQTGIPASLQILNNSTPPESAGNTTINSINLVPACGTPAATGAGDCPLASADPGVFQISPTATGEAGTACAGVVFTVSIIDAATGQVTFTPTGGPVVLTPPPTMNDVCRIDFTFSVLKAPTKDADTALGLQTDQIGFATGTSAVDGATGSGIGTSSVTVALAQPGITTAATATSTVGAPITDTATLTAAPLPTPAPTGTITFNLFPNVFCTGMVIFTSTVPVTSGGGSYTSAPFTPTLPGTYRWIAAYSGDANNNSATTACGDAGETSVISLAMPTLVTTASASVPAGGMISDTATLTGGFNPTGTITFTLFGPANPGCTGTPIFTSTKTVAGDGAYTSDPFTTTLAGTYNFVAVYSGDAGNAAVTSACGAANESVVVTVTKATTALATVASATAAPAGGTISDTATLTGGVTPTGTITFTLFGPNNAACTGTAIFTSTKTVAGDGSYTSDNFTTAAVGAYNFVAIYSGDANNAGSMSVCGAMNESVVVTQATPTLATTASPSVPA
ncbi:MAG: hypothetical protein ACYDCQ_17270, partial [Dehalococcoidia bacterium]